MFIRRIGRVAMKDLLVILIDSILRSSFFKTSWFLIPFCKNRAPSNIVLFNLDGASAVLKKSAVQLLNFSLLVFAGLAFAGPEIIRTNDALKSYKKEYLNAAGHKAFAQSPSGAWAWRAERTTREFAIEDAINACNSYQEASEPRCVVIHVDNEWVTP